MGKAVRWLKDLLGFKKPDPKHDPSQKPESKKRWTFAAKSHKEKDRHKSKNGVASGGYDDDKANRNALAVAAATAAIAEAAVAAAQVAASVVTLTSGGGNKGSDGGFNSVACSIQNGTGCGSREELAAVMIQSHFRAYLSRRALWALKALVKLQALVRGQILRKQYEHKLQQRQAIVRAQARTQAGQVLISEVPHSSAKSSPLNFTGQSMQEPLDYKTQTRSTKQEQLMTLKRNGSRSNSCVTFDLEKSHLIRHLMDRGMGDRSWEQGSFTRIVPTDDEKSDKILQVDKLKQHLTRKRRNIFHSPHLSYSSDQYCESFSTSARRTTGLSPSSGKILSLSPVDIDAFATAENSPLYYSASSTGGGSKRAPFTPTRSDGTRSCLSGYSDHPSYMAYTESSKAKVRSISAPKQRLQHERSSSTTRHSVHGYGDLRHNTKKASSLHANFTNKAYPGLGRLDRLGMPVRDASEFSGGHWHRY